jgi:hypothetical protein
MYIHITGMVNKQFNYINTISFKRNREKTGGFDTVHMFVFAHACVRTSKNLD